MDAKELRQLGADELKGRVKQLKDDFFRSKFKRSTSENKNTAVFKNLRRDIARTLTVLNEKARGVEFKAAAPQVVADKPVTKAKKSRKKEE